jgi:hypothetical protein
MTHATPEARNAAREILLRAAEIIAAQPSVPPSPGRKDGDRVLLCAGAAMAAAGIELCDGAERRDDFARRIAGAQGMTELYAEIRALGWEQAFCHDAIRANDAQPDEARKAAMCAMLVRMAAEEPDRLFRA